MSEINSQYFQRKRIGIVLSPKTFSEMQRIRSLYLLSGKKLGDLPTITDFINGIIVSFYFQLDAERRLIVTYPDEYNNGTIIFNLKKYFSKVEIEKALDKQEYEDFVSALPEDTFKLEIESEIEIAGKKFINMDREQFTEINVEIPPNPTLGDSQQISLMLTEEMVIWARKINKLINDIFQNRILYSLSDLVKTIVEVMIDAPFNIRYPVQIYIAHLYNIEPKEYIKFRESYFEVTRTNPEYRNLIGIITDKPIVDSFNEIQKEIDDAYDKQGFGDNTRKMNKLLNEIDRKLDYDKLWSYVSDFNYKRAAEQFDIFKLAVSWGLNISDITSSLYHGGLESMFEKSPVLYKYLAAHRIRSYYTFFSNLRNFMNKVYAYASLPNK